MSQTRRLAAILAADVAGYSRLMGADEEGTLERLKALRRELLDPKIAEHHGRIVKTTGDGVLVEFASVVDAVRCAVAVQQAMPERNTSVAADNRIELRIGVNLGDVIVEGDDLYGDGVNIAARIEALADAGGVFVSNTVHDHVRDRLPFVFEDLGEQQVKNIVRPVRVYRVRAVGDTARAATPPVLALPDKPSIAVLPFANMSGDPEQEFFSDGITEDITTALSKVRWFFVIARNSSFTYKGRAVEVKQVGRELGVRYVLEGSVRKAGNRVRITAQLVDATIGNHVWAERYDRELADIFTVQDEITERVVAAIEPQLYAAEHFRSQRKPPESLDAWECVIRALSRIAQGSLAGYNEAEALCRRAIAISRNYGQAHSLLAWVLLRRTDWLGDVASYVAEAEVEARTALDIDELDPWAHLTHGLVRYRQRRHGEAERAYRRALELNPNFALAHAVLGLPLAYHGAHREAVESAERAMRLSPSDPLVGRQASHTMAFAEFAAARYADCVTWARRTIERHPGHLPPYHALIAAAALQGDTLTAAEALEGLAEPGGICVSALVQRDAAGKLDLAFEDLGELTLKNIARPLQVYRVATQRDVETATEPAPLPLPDKPSVAVLPFTNIPEQEFVSDGIAEDVITALSRYPSLFVIARNSCFTYKGRAVDVKQVGRELGVRYVLEGSVRKAGNRIRVTAQLVEAETGNHVWAERYDRDLADIFAVQDEITEAVTVAIAPAIADAELQRAVRKPPDSLDAWAAYQRGLWHLSEANQEDNATAQRFFQKAIDLDSTFAGGYSGLALAQLQAAAVYQKLDLLEAQSSAEALARRAVALDGADAEARSCLGWALQARGELEGALAEIERALVMSPNLAVAHGQRGATLIFSGRPKEGLAAVQTSIRLDPRDPFSAIRLLHIACGLYFSGEYEEAIEAAKRLIRSYPDFPMIYRWPAAALGQLGRTAEAKEALDKAISLAPAAFDMYVRKRVPWFRPEDHAHLLEGLQKAGWEG